MRLQIDHTNIVDLDSELSYLRKQLFELDVALDLPDWWLLPKEQVTSIDNYEKTYRAIALLEEHYEDHPSS